MKQEEIVAALNEALTQKAVLMQQLGEGQQMLAGLNDRVSNLRGRLDQLNEELPNGMVGASGLDKDDGGGDGAGDDDGGLDNGVSLHGKPLKPSHRRDRKAR